MAREPIDYYALLRVTPRAHSSVIDAAYRAMAQTDAAADPMVLEAYRVLSDESLRSSYDEWYLAWKVNRPEEVRAEARRRARRRTHRQARIALRKLESTAHHAKNTAARQATTLRRARTDQKERAGSLPAVRRNAILHPVRMILLAVVVLGLLAVAIMVPVKLANERAEQERARQAQEAADAEAARIAEAEAHEAAVAATMQAAHRQAESLNHTVGDAQRAEAAAEVEAARAAEEAALQEARRTCLEAVSDEAASVQGCDFTNADLANVDFTGRDLTGANFANADLTGAIFDDATLTDARWTGTTCPDSSMAILGTGCLEALLEPGDRTRALQVGDKAQVGDWTVTVTGYQADAQSTWRAVDWINNEPGDGFVYAIVGLTVIYDGTGQDRSPGNLLEVAINDVVEGTLDTQCYLPENYGAGDYLNTGQSTSYEVCMYLPTETATTGTVGIHNGYGYNSDEATYWAMPEP